MNKHKLNDFDTQIAFELRDANWSLARIAKRFDTNKPSILKALHLWDSGEQKTPDGKKFIITRGKVIMLPDEKDIQIEKLIKESKKIKKTK